MDYTVEYGRSWMLLPEFCQKYQHQEKFLAYCRACDNYQHRWSCPELNFDSETYLSAYRSIYIVGAKISLADELIQQADTAEKVKETGWRVILKVKHDLERRLRELESKAKGSVALSSGGCRYCKTCSRIDEKPCRHPELMRYSLDAFGFDLSAITRELLGFEIKWCQGRLPDYFTLVHGLLVQELVPEKTWQASGL